jgi:hypothetical protein
MASIPSKKLASIARDAAFEMKLPWRVKELRAKALAAYRTVDHSAASLGLPPKQDDDIRRFIYEQVKKTGQGMEALPPDQKKPTPEQIVTALETFTIEQWATLIDRMSQVEAQSLLSYIRQYPGELKQRLGARKLRRIEGHAIMRDTDLWLRDNRPKLVPISDVYWAVALRDLALEANTKGKGHSTKGPPMAEQAKAPHIARHLSKRDEQIGHDMKVSAY